VTLRVPESIDTDEQVLSLSDVIPTGYFGADIANVQPGDDIAVFGAGLVGYFAVMSSFLRGAARVFASIIGLLDWIKTKDLGAEIINFDNEDPVERIRKETIQKIVKIAILLRHVQIACGKNVVTGLTYISQILNS
jgi:S-(hydroxymethyl)glutathione dehydrogenase / alcohol dehydrogenase